MQEIMEQSTLFVSRMKIKKEDNAIFDDVTVIQSKNREENAIENTSVFVPAFDEEERIINPTVDTVGFLIFLQKNSTILVNGYFLSSILYETENARKERLF